MCPNCGRAGTVPMFLFVEPPHMVDDVPEDRQNCLYPRTEGQEANLREVAPPYFGKEPATRVCVRACMCWGG